MVMADRPEVDTAPRPVAVLDVAGLAQQIAIAVGRLPFRRPLAGPSNPLANLAASATREVVRSFMGYATSLTVPEFRSIEQVLDETCKVVMPPVVRAFDAERRFTRIGGVPGILYLPRRAEPEGVILYLHGGGYIGTSPTMYAFFTSRLCRDTRCAVFVADYRLAPEFPYPAGLDDARQILEALIDLGVPGERLFVAGDSGGGGLANSLALSAASGDHPITPAGLILFSPEVDLGLNESSVTSNAERDILPWNIPTAPYLNGVDPADAGVSSVNADLSGFPPTYVTWGGDEMFRDPIRRLVAELESNDVMTHAHEVPGMFHVFPILLPWSERSREVSRQVSAFVEGLMAEQPAMAPGLLARDWDEGWAPFGFGAPLGTPRAPTSPDDEA